MAARHEQPHQGSWRWRRPSASAWSGRKATESRASARPRAQVAAERARDGCAGGCPVRRGSDREDDSAGTPGSRRRRGRAASPTTAAGIGSSQQRPTASSVAGASSERRRLSSIFQRPTRAASPRPRPNDPGQELPVAARPAMLALGGDVVAGRELLDDLDVGREARAGEDAFEEIVAEQGVLRHAPGERRLEGIDVVDALAGVGALAEQVLVDVGDRRRIGVDAAGTGEDTLDRAIPRGRAAATGVTRGCRMRIAADDPLLAVARTAAGSAGGPSCRSAAAPHRAAAWCRHRA